ncbi:UNVERIFIED_CONTAM: hypothetical protein GTU68_042854 [Idotea baltica]|nr:hypothetical protein [Idotea baltica]
MLAYQSSNHSKWYCKYHVVFIPKYRKKVIYGNLRSYLGDIIKEMAKRRECMIEEGHLMKDHVHILISIPPKISVASSIGYIKGKTAIEIARKFGKRKNFTGQSFWARGYLASTVGNNESVIRDYIKNQEDEDRKIEQLRLFN